MDNTAHDQQHKDFLAFFNPADGGMTLDQGAREHRALDGGHPQGHQLAFNTPSAHAGTSTGGMQNSESQLNMDMLGNLMAMHGVAQQAISQQQQPYSPQMMLEQQFKLNQLQQLQQLQNQIFQQQIALISGQGGLNGSESSPDAPRASQQSNHGLPTPGSSTELRPQSSNDYVSPMILQYMDAPQCAYTDTSMDTLTPQQRQTFARPQQGSSSAPAHIAFNTTPSQPLPSPHDIDFDISPLTSPWLGAHQHSRAQPPSSAPNKRTASPSGEDMARKRQSPAIRPSNPGAPQPKKMGRASKSASSTPLMRSSTRPRAGSTTVPMEAVGDTPSPVDLSMPPPAPPSNAINAMSSSSASPTSPVTPVDQSTSNLTPVTPASIMNLGRLGLDSGLTPLSSPRGKNGSGTRGPGRPKAQETVGTRSAKPARKASGSAPIASPILKPLLPAGQPGSSGGASASTSAEPPRKTSHKAAEQKRRDSLKTTFDELRVLLPPIPLLSEDQQDEKPVLPGALPPRGPGREGPNRGVSKLQLLMCGNDHIRRLNGRIERRDEEIRKLRKEVTRLRAGGAEEAEDIDLDLDLDACEAPLGMSGGGDSTGGIDEDD